MPSVAPKNTEVHYSNSNNGATPHLSEPEEQKETQPEKIIIEPEPTVTSSNNDTIKESKVEKKDKFDSLGLFKNKKTVFLMFIIPPIIISLISAYHLITFYSSANPFNTAIILAFAIEMASMSSLIALAFLDRLRRGTIWTIFIVLVTLQILGNTFHSFVYLQEQTEMAKLLFNFLSLDNSLSSYRIISLIMGLPLPIIALAFIKGAVEYLE